VSASHDFRVSPRSKRVKAAAVEQDRGEAFFFFTLFLQYTVRNMADDSYAREEEGFEEEELDETVNARILSEYRSPY